MKHSNANFSIGFYVIYSLHSVILLFNAALIFRVPDGLSRVHVTTKNTGQAGNFLLKSLMFFSRTYMETVVCYSLLRFYHGWLLII